MYACGILRVPNVIPIEFELQGMGNAYQFLRLPWSHTGIEPLESDLYTIRPVDQEIGHSAWSFVNKHGEMAVRNKPMRLVGSVFRNGYYTSFETNYTNAELRDFRYAINTLWWTATRTSTLFHLMIQAGMKKEEIALFAKAMVDAYFGEKLARSMVYYEDVLRAESPKNLLHKLLGFWTFVDDNTEQYVYSNLLREQVPFHRIMSLL